MKPSKVVMRIIWAIEPSKPSPLLYESSAQFINRLLDTPGMNTIIEPVTVLSMIPELSADFTARRRSEYCAAAEDELTDLLKTLQLRNTMPPHAIFLDSPSRKNAVDALSEHAKRHGAQLILAQPRFSKTHTLQESFTETLTQRSKVPVLLLKKDMSQFQNILFPKGFGAGHRAHLHHLLELTKARETIPVEQVPPKAA